MNELSSWRTRHLAKPDDILPEYSYLPPEDEVHLVDYWNILVKRRRIIITLFLSVFALGAYFPLSATKLYSAKATLKIEPHNPQVTGIVELQPLELRGEYDYYRTQFALLGSRPLAARVISDLGLKSNRAFTSSRIVSPNPLEHIKSWLFRILGYISYYLGPLIQTDLQIVQSDTDKSIPEQYKDKVQLLNVDPYLIKRYSEFLNIEPVKQTRLVQVVFSTPDPALSQVLANAHVQNFVQMSLESRFSLTKEAREFLDQKKIELRRQLENSETSLNNFRRTHGVVSVEKGENIVVDRLVDLNKQLTVARAQRIEAETLYRTVENKQYQDLAEIAKQGLVQQLKGNVASLEAEKARLSTIFKPDHPRVKEVAQQITLAQQALNSEIGNVVKGLKSGYTAALAKERGLQAEAEKQQQDALRLRELAVDYAVLQQEVNADRTLYENVLKRLSETNVSNDIAVSNLQIVERAFRPEDPSSPNTGLYLLAIMISGLFFSVGIAFVQECLDSTLGTADDVRRSVGLSTLGVVPRLKFLTERTHNNRAKIDDPRLGCENSRVSTHAGATAKDLIISHDPISIISESYRNIRTAFLLSQVEKPPQVVLLTSAAAGEGKTTTTLNLSIALAYDGYSVLVVDGDMRKGLCHARLGLRNNEGLSNVLAGGLSLEEVIQPTSVSGLSLLSRGTVPPNPTELLGSIKMKEMLQKLRQTFAFILIDSPPVVVISDAAVLSGTSDGVLLVIDGQRTSRLSAQKAIEQLDMVRAPVLGVILNGVNLDDPYYSHYRTCSYYLDNGPDSDGKLHDSNSNGSAKSIFKFNTMNRFSQMWSGQASQHARHSTERPATNGSIEECREERFESTATLRTLADKDKKVISETAASQATNVVEKDSIQEIAGAELLPQESLDRLIAAVAKSIGAIAPLVVREHIRALGESYSAFPKQRIGELLKLLQQEITQRTTSSQVQESARDSKA